MKRFSEMADGITRAARTGRAGSLPGVEEPPGPPRDRYACQAWGCPMPGALSGSTLGAGPWYCRFHFGRLPAEFDEITNGLRYGTTLADEAERRRHPSPTVKAVWARTKFPPERAREYPEREPGQEG